MRVITFSAMLLVGATATPLLANAADLGGDCCADLEERIAELEATAVRKGNRKVSLTVYGKINEAIGFWDDGAEDNVYIFTNDTSRTRFGFKGKAKINSDWFAKFRIEIGVRSADQGDLTADSDDTTGAGPLDLRRSEWTLGSKTYGSITVGETKFANDGVTQTQLANIKHFANPDIFDSNDEFQIRSGRDRFQDVVEWGDAVQVLEPGEGSRGNVVRYETPSIAGFKASAAFGEDDVWNVALRYAQQFADFKFAGSIGYGEATENDEECGEFGTDAGSPNSKCQNFGLSGSLKHSPTGLFVTGAYGRHEDEARQLALQAAGLSGDDASEFYHIQAGIEQKWLPYGKSTLFGGYQERNAGTPINPATGALINADDGVVAGSILDTEVEMFEVGFNQKVDAAAMDLYVIYRHFDADITTTNGALDTEEWQTVIVGSQIKF